MDFLQTSEEFSEIRPAREFIIKAIKEICSVSSIWDRIVVLLIILLSGLISYKVSYAYKTVEFVAKICEHLLEIQLALFSCIFAVYSILLAFLSDKYMKKLATIKVNDKESTLKRYTTYYESVLFLFFINIAVTGILLLITDFIPIEASLTSSLVLDNILSALGLFIYFNFSFRVFYEIKSTIYNTIILFRYSIAYRFLAFSKENGNKENNLQNKDDGEK